MLKFSLLCSGPLDDEFSYEPPGKKNRSSDSTDSAGSSTTSNRKEAPILKMPKSPRGNQKAASTDVSTIIPKSDIRRAQFKGSKSMPAVDASSPEPIVSSTKETEEIPVAIEMSSTGRPAETTNLHLKYLLQVTDSELQNMSREVPSSQTISMGVPSGGKPMTNTQLVLAPVTTSQPSENFIFQEIIKMPVSEKGVEKYHVKSDSLEQQGLKLVYTKPTVDSQEARPMSYVAYKPHSQHQSTEKSLQQQQSMTGDSTVGRKRKHPLKQGRHICQYCGRGCAKPSVLEKHIRAHTNERPFPCANCGLSFKTKSNLSKHTKSRTHALKAGLSQSASSTSSETAGTEGDVDAKDTNESEETQTETSDTDGENEDDPQKTKGNLTKHMKSKAHQKKCLELGIVPVPVTVDESQIDSVALAAQSAIAKDTKILDDDNEEDEDDDKDMDDEEETDDADGQFSDSEESARTSFERMDTSETIDTSVDKESECGTPAQTSSIDVAEICRMPEVHSCELSEPEVSTTAELTKTTTSNLAMSSSQVPLSLQTLTTVNASHRQEATEKTLKRQYSFDMADSPDRGLSKSPTLQLEFPDIQMHLVSKIYQKDQHSLLKQTSSEEIAMLNQQTATAIGENSSHKEIRSGEIEKIGSQILTHPSIVALKIDSQEGYQRQPFITTTTAIQNNQPLTHNVYLIPDLPGNLQGTIEKETSYGATTTSTLSLSLTGLLPNISQLVKQESDSGPVISASLISHPQSITPFQFEHPFQAFQRSSNKNEETRAEPQTVIIPLTTSGTEESTFVCSPKAVRVSQSLSRESPAMEMMVSRSEVATSCQQGQILLPSQLGPNNPSIVSIIVSNQTCQNVENVAQQPQMGHKHQSQLVSNSPYIGPANIPTQPFNTNIVVEPHIVENLIPEHSQTRLAELQPVSLIMEKSTTESKLLVTRQSPTAIVEKTFHSEQCPTSFERHSPKLYIDNSQTRSAYGNGQTRVHVERRIPMLQPMIPNVQLPPQEVGKLSPTQRIESASPPRHYVERLSPKRQHVERLSPTRQHVERLSPTRQHVERLSPTRQHVDMLTPTRYHVDALSPTRKSISALSPSRQHVDNLSSSWPQVDTLSSSSQPMDMVSSLRQPIIDKQMDRLSPSKKLTGDRLSPTRQHLDNLSPTSQHIDRLTTFRVCTEKLSPSRPFSSQSPTQTTGKLSPIRLTDKPPFKRQTNRLSPSRHVEGLSSVRQLDRLSPARQTERLSPGRYENLSPTRVQARLSPCRLEQQWPSDHQLPLRIVESQPQHLDSKLLCTTTETQHRVCEKQSSTGIPESQVLSSVSTSQNKALTMQPSVEGPSSLKNSSSSLQHSRLLKSFKDDLNKCHICNKCFSNAQEYIEHQRQHMKTQTHHSQDSSCGHSRPHLHKCFHSEGHADSWSMSTEEIPRPPDCKNCKMDFWKQNHLPKHLWAKKHRLTLMWNKNSSSTDSESAAPSEAMPDAVVTTTSVSGPSRVKTIQGTEKALDLSIDESSIITSLSSTSVTATCTTVTSVTTTAAVTVTTTAVMAKDMASDEHALMIAEARCVSREQAAIISADVTDQSSFFIHQRPVSKKYVDSSSEQVKDETVEADILRSGIRNPTYYVLTGDESEITGANVIPITPMAAHATHACHLCSRTFTSAYQLEDHLSHADPRPYVCEYCDAGFSKKQTLRIHLQIHSQQEKPYVCGMCGDTFVTSESLKQHSLIHSNIIVGAHRSFDESALYSYQQGTRIGSPLPKAYDRGVHIATSQLCSQDHFSTSFPPPPPPMISTPVQVSALNIQQKQPQYRLPSSQAQQYMEISPYNTGDTRPVMVASTLAALALDSAVSKP
ncbi:HIVEP [Acanthosepion pharaonis]|uniref:HIVEP n=1 Tax=Acanthosepion pharaonis TaxID=158019 RepID=A0A812DB14_ACAPH|nr:HIVEP [Sepia pharaonis]